MNPDELRRAQTRTMADPDRLRLFAAVLTAPSGRPTADDLTAPGEDVAVARSHLQAMSDVGLVALVGSVAPGDEVAGPSVAPEVPEPRYRVTPRGIVRFGGSALAQPRFPDDPALDEHDHPALLRRVTEILSESFADSAGPGTVDRLVRESYTMLDAQTGGVGHLPAITAWLATDRLAALKAPLAPHRSLDVLFVCVHNQGRSQIAAALTRRLVGDRIRVRTAGTRPAATADPVVRAVLARRGLDGLVEFPRPLTDELVRASGFIVTMGCGDACPVLPGRRYLDWPLDDPAGRSVAEVEQIVDDIAGRVRGLVAEIEATAPVTAGAGPAGGQSSSQSEAAAIAALELRLAK
ncbi:low molecular weight phosphatase family protein [Antribacter sp. KLBMP9083]|uniref:Low molecular weight phosphatase family protein n=1 Tax=Antribacter soli TaxID=2910976 RepID=A0AA41U8C0_9MICO|nr:low molecular weight phosphatase family protein [Antribacter soli]MCF4120332.1 low molecular weight phosphatase family protein [Antribacter soli]